MKARTNAAISLAVGIGTAVKVFNDLTEAMPTASTLTKGLLSAGSGAGAALVTATGLAIVAGVDLSDYYQPPKP